MNVFKHAIARIPGANFSQGLTTATLGAPIYAIALEQHKNYCEALRRCGVHVEVLPADLHYPDSTFVEDTAVLTEKCAIITNPGAESRKGEVIDIRARLAPYYHKFYTITPPGTLDGGDVCEADGHFFIGLSERTNASGGDQLAEFLAQEGYSSSLVELRGMKGILHLKSGLAYLGGKNLVLINTFIQLKIFKDYNLIHVQPDENYAANCIWVNNVILLPHGFPHLQQSIEELGYQVILLDMSEFQKMDGGLSCLSLRF